MKAYTSFLDMLTLYFIILAILFHIPTTTSPIWLSTKKAHHGDYLADFFRSGQFLRVFEIYLQKL